MKDAQERYTATLKSAVSNQHPPKADPQRPVACWTGMLALPACITGTSEHCKLHTWLAVAGIPSVRSHLPKRGPTQSPAGQVSAHVPGTSDAVARTPSTGSYMLTLRKGWEASAARVTVTSDVVPGTQALGASSSAEKSNHKIPLSWHVTASRDMQTYKQLSNGESLGSKWDQAPVLPTVTLVRLPPLLATLDGRATQSKSGRLFWSTFAPQPRSADPVGLHWSSHYKEQEVAGQLQETIHQGSPSAKARAQEMKEPPNALEHVFKLATITATGKVKQAFLAGKRSLTHPAKLSSYATSSCSSDSPQNLLISASTKGNTLPTPAEIKEKYCICIDPGQQGHMAVYVSPLTPTQRTFIRYTINPPTAAISPTTARHPELEELIHSPDKYESDGLALRPPRAVPSPSEHSPTPNSLFGTCPSPGNLPEQAFIYDAAVERIKALSSLAVQLDPLPPSTMLPCIPHAAKGADEACQPTPPKRSQSKRCKYLIWAFESAIQLCLIFCSHYSSVVQMYVAYGAASFSSSSPGSASSINVGLQHAIRARGIHLYQVNEWGTSQ
ncbi:hypothetical protein BDK51DRAFT_43528, partial [Blyttiomyces helicus]